MRERGGGVREGGVRGRGGLERGRGEGGVREREAEGGEREGER